MVSERDIIYAEVISHDVELETRESKFGTKYFLVAEVSLIPRRTEPKTPIPYNGSGDLAGESIHDDLRVRIPLEKATYDELKRRMKESSQGLRLKGDLEILAS